MFPEMEVLPLPLASGNLDNSSASTGVCRERGLDSFVVTVESRGLYLLSRVVWASGKPGDA
jgi:hypothetical protein